MLPQDFKTLFSVFHHGHTFATYLSNIYLDSLFNVQDSTVSKKKEAAE